MRDGKGATLEEKREDIIIGKEELRFQLCQQVDP